MTRSYKVRKQVMVDRPDLGVAFARALFEGSSVCHCDLAAQLLDQELSQTAW
jgi:hypothetical protein